MAERREYVLEIRVNGIRYERILIDSHYQIRHFGSISDTLICRLVGLLDGRSFDADAINPSGHEFFVDDRLELDGLRYRLIWTSHPKLDYIGVINAFRR